MIMLCRYKPCALWLLFHMVVSAGMVFFTMAMYMFIGGFYPSERLVFGWYWSLTHHTTSLLLSLFSAVYIYENFLEIHWNRLVLIGKLVACLSAGALAATIWPQVERKSFESFVKTHYRENFKIPVFLEWFQFSQGCCGVNNYKDYIHYLGTHQTYVKYHGVETVKQDSPNYVPPPDDGEEDLTKLYIDAKKLSRVTFSVPRSCCSLRTRNRTDCGENIDYMNTNEIKNSINNVTKGCYNLFKELIYGYKPTQVCAMYVTFRTYPVFDIFLHLIGFYVHAYYYDQNLKAIHAPDDSGSDSTSDLEIHQIQMQDPDPDPDPALITTETDTEQVLPPEELA